MDIQARALFYPEHTDLASFPATPDDVQAGSLHWCDAAGYRLHVNVVKNADGAWGVRRDTVRKGSARRFEQTIYANPPGVGGLSYVGGRTTHRDATAKANAATVAYVLEQQNRHGLIQDNARDQLHRYEAARAAEEKADADRIKDAFAKATAASLEAGEISKSTFENLTSLAVELSDDSWRRMGQALRGS